jgi:hypothetical protein
VALLGSELGLDWAGTQGVFQRVCCLVAVMASLKAHSCGHQLTADKSHPLLLAPKPELSPFWSHFRTPGSFVHVCSTCVASIQNFGKSVQSHIANFEDRLRCKTHHTSPNWASQRGSCTLQCPQLILSSTSPAWPQLLYAAITATSPVQLSCNSGQPAS